MMKEDHEFSLTTVKPVLLAPIAAPYHALASRPQRSAATSRVSAAVPRSDRTQRTSDLVTTPGEGLLIRDRLPLRAIGRDWRQECEPTLLHRRTRCGV